jgi:hypothetical protein
VPSDLPRNLVVEGPGRGLGEALAGEPAGDSGVTRRSTDPVPAPDLEREAGEVKQRVDGMLADTSARHRLATIGFDSDTLELGRAFERAAVLPPSEAERRWIETGLAAYREELKHLAERMKPRGLAPADSSRESTWEQRVDLARGRASRAAGRYVALVEVRRTPGGGLAELRLLASSGLRSFDERALGCVVRGLPSAAGQAPAPGQLALWEFAGEKLPDSKLIQGAKKLKEFALLDVVPLKETLVELDRGGLVEQLKFSARLLAIY